MQERLPRRENSSVEVQSKHSVEEIPSWRHSSTIDYLFLPKGLDSGCQMPGSVIHIYKERLWFSIVLHKNWVQSGFYTSQKVRFRVSGDGDYDSSQEYKESIPYFYFWLTVIEWLGIDLTGTVSVNAPLFGHIYIPWVNSQHWMWLLCWVSRSLKPLMF